jgi:hypothetical protein
MQVVGVHSGIDHHRLKAEGVGIHWVVVCERFTVHSLYISAFLSV